MAIISKRLDPGATAPPLAGFALAWRWHGAGRHPLPSEVLAQLRVLPPAQARVAFDLSSRLMHGQGLDATRFTLSRCDAAGPHATHPANARHALQVARWMRREQPTGTTRVWLSWEPELALCTRWDLFVRHWPAFCYPDSDDLVVFPASGRWALFHHHAQRLEFGCLQAGATPTPSLRKASGPLQDTGPTRAA